MTSKILVSGLINIETTLRVEAFPLTYKPVRYPFFGINTTVSGVGYNIARALTTLGMDIDFISLIGNDLFGQIVRESLVQDGISDLFIENLLPQTPQSVIIYDKDGRRQIHTDLKDIQDRSYPPQKIFEALAHCGLAVLCNINYNRAFLPLARDIGKFIATDVHTLSRVDDDYNQDFLAAADILFLSDELLPTSPEEFVRELQDRYGTALIIVGLGSEGALLAVKQDNFLERVPASATDRIVNTIGAGDALFSAFIYEYTRSKNPYVAIRKALVFAAHKIAFAGASEGFITNSQLEYYFSSNRENSSGLEDAGMEQCESH